MERPDARSARATAVDADEPPVEAGDGSGSVPDEASGADAAASAWGDRLPSNAVALAIASREHVVAGELPPLYGSVDPDGLDALLRSAPGASVTFTHHGYEVTVTGEGAVELTPLDES